MAADRASRHEQWGGEPRGEGDGGIDPQHQGSARPAAGAHRRAENDNDGVSYGERSRR
jgi:hypothetical protein